MPRFLIHRNCENVYCGDVVGQQHIIQYSKLLIHRTCNQRNVETSELNISRPAKEVSNKQTNKKPRSSSGTLQVLVVKRTCLKKWESENLKNWLARPKFESVFCL